MGEETRVDISFLQSLFWKSDKAGEPYVYSRFKDDLNKEKNPRLVEIRDSLEKWLNAENAHEAAAKLKEFESTFSKAIDRFYTGWAA